MHELETYKLAIIALGAIAFGVYLLVKGGDWTIDNAVVIAERSGLSKLFISATIVAFGTSAPELFTSINANLSGYPGIAVGNVIGSNIANVLLVVAVSAIIAPLVWDRAEVRVDVLVMLAATVAMTVGIIAGIIPRWAGLAMVAGIIIYVLYQYKASKLDVEDEEQNESDGPSPGVMLAVGIITLLIGSEILVQGAVAGGVALGVPEAVIGMTLIAFGTSLPELTACVAAARKNQSDMIVGGIIGSNIFNILSVLAFSAITKAVIIDERFAEFDMYVVIGVTLLFSFFLLIVGRMDRYLGLAMFVSYIAFISAQYLLF
jgi:cation:H+ antiporter